MKKHGNHLGAMPRCRKDVKESLDLVRKVLQPAINQDIVEVFKKYLSVSLVTELEQPLHYQLSFTRKIFKTACDKAIKVMNLCKADDHRPAFKIWVGYHKLDY